MERISVVIHTYLTLAVTLEETDYGDPPSRARHNVVADRLRAIAVEVASRPQADVFEFVKLLDDVGSAAQLWAAHHVVELLPVPKDVIDRAIAIIEAASLGDTARAMGQRIWLNDWNARRSSPHHPRRNDA